MSEAIKETVLGPDHPELAATLNNLALVRHDRGDPDAATRLYRRAIAMGVRQKCRSMTFLLVTEPGGCGSTNQIAVARR